MSRFFPDPLAFNTQEYLVAPDPVFIPEHRQYGSGSWVFVSEGNPVPDETTIPFGGPIGGPSTPFPALRPGCTLLFWLEWDGYQTTDQVSVSDDQGNVWRLAIKDGVVGKLGMALFYSAITSSGVGINPTITFNPGHFFLSCRITCEWGLGALDQVASAKVSGNTAALTTPTINPSPGHSLVLSRWATDAFHPTTNLIVPSDQYLELSPISLNNPNGPTLWAQGSRKYYRSSNPVSMSATAPFTSSDWLGLIANFKLLSGYDFPKTDLFDLNAFTWFMRIKPSVDGLSSGIGPTCVTWNPEGVGSPSVNIAQGVLSAFLVGNDGVSFFMSTSGDAPLLPDQWYSLAITFDFNGDKKIHLYVDGDEVSSYTQQDTATVPPIPNYASISNGILNGTSQFFDFGGTTGQPLGPMVVGTDLFGDSVGGDVAEVAVWNRALSSAEIATADASTNGLLPLFLSSSLVGYWHVCGLSSPEPDATGGTDLTLGPSPLPQAENSPGYSACVPPVPVRRVTVNGFKRGQFQSFGASSPFTGFVGDLYLTTDGDHNLFVAVTPFDAFVLGLSANQQAQHPRIFQKGGVVVKSGVSSNLPQFATVGTVLVTLDTLQAFVGLGSLLPIYRINLDVGKVIKSGLITQSFSAADPISLSPPSGSSGTVVLFDLNG